MSHSLLLVLELSHRGCGCLVGDVNVPDCLPDPGHCFVHGSVLRDIPSGDADSDEPPLGSSSSSLKTSEKQESSDSDKGHHLMDGTIGKHDKRKHDALDGHDSDSEGYEDEDEW